MNFNFHNNLVKKQTKPFKESEFSTHNKFKTEQGFKFDPKSVPFSQKQVIFDKRTNPFFNPVTPEEIEELTIDFDALSLEKDINEIEKTVKKEKFQANSDWAQKKLEKFGVTRNPFALPTKK